MATDTWQAACERIAALWRRHQPHRAEIVAAGLAADREDVLAACAVGDQETLGELGEHWQGRFRRLLVARPVAIGEVRWLLGELHPARVPAAFAITQRAGVSARKLLGELGSGRWSPPQSPR